jgi:hypothetical protein
MASIVSAGTTSATALNMSADTTGILQLASNNGTVALTIDASQNVGFGTASPTQPVTVFKAYNGATWINVVNTTSGTGSSTGLLMTTDSSIQATIELDSTAFSSFANALRIRQIGAYPIVFSTSDSERLRITSNGLILAGASSVLSGQGGSARIQSTGNIAISGTDGELILSNSGSDPRTWRILSSTGGGITARLRFYDDNAGAERMSITKTGEVLIGTIQSALNTEILAIQNTGGGTVVMRIQRSGENPGYIGSGSANPFSVWDSAINQRFAVTSAGSCQNTTGSYGSFSDAKLKENIVDATPKLDDLMKVKVRNYGLKAEPNSKFIGFIAQELQEVFPSMIETFEDEDEKGEKTGEVTLGVKTTVLVPMLVKAIQELNAKVTALENK